MVWGVSSRRPGSVDICVVCQLSWGAGGKAAAAATRHLDYSEINNLVKSQDRAGAREGAPGETSTTTRAEKKRKPLVLPPDYNEIPEPGTKTENKINENEKIKKLLKSTEKNNIKNDSSSTEQSILNKIRKWKKYWYGSW